MDAFRPRYLAFHFVEWLRRWNNPRRVRAGLTFPDKQNISSRPTVWRRPVRRDIWLSLTPPPWVTKVDGKFPSPSPHLLSLYVVAGEKYRIFSTRRRAARTNFEEFQSPALKAVNLSLVVDATTTIGTIRSVSLKFHVCRF